MKLKIRLILDIPRQKDVVDETEMVVEPIVEANK